MATINSLANETLCKIMEMLKTPLPSWDDSPDPPPGRYDALRAAALVCSRWSESAQRALFDEVEIYLRHLSIGTYEIADEPLGSGNSLPADLSSLTLRTSFNEAAAAFLGAISSASKYNLTTLRLQIIHHAGVALLPALSAISPLIETLVLESDSHGILESYLDVFPILQALRSFSWHKYSPFYSLQASDVENLRTALDAFPTPATLTHLSFGTDDFCSLERIIPLLDHPTLALLAKLDFPSLAAPSPIDQASAVAALAQACEDRNICLSIGGAEM